MFTSMKENHRNYFRYALRQTTCVKLSIHKIKETVVNSPAACALLYDCGPGGLCVITSLNLPQHSDVEYTFQFRILDYSFTFKGKLAWKRQANNIYYYGATFDITEQERDQLIMWLNKLMGYEKRKIYLPTPPQCPETGIHHQHCSVWRKLVDMHNDSSMTRKVVDDF